MRLETEIIGFIAGLFTTICMLPQLIQLIRTKNTNGISLLSFSALIIGQFLWLIYGILVPDIRLIITNMISVFISIISFSYIVFLRKTSLINLP